MHFFSLLILSTLILFSKSSILGTITKGEVTTVSDTVLDVVNDNVIADPLKGDGKKI